jgi:hypothetical protein
MGHGARAVDSSLPTRHLSLSSSRPAAGSRERARKSRTAMCKTRTYAPLAVKGYLTPFLTPFPLTPFPTLSRRKRMQGYREFIRKSRTHEIATSVVSNK